KSLPIPARIFSAILCTRRHAVLNTLRGEAQLSVTRREDSQQFGHVGNVPHDCQSQMRPPNFRTQTPFVAKIVSAYNGANTRRRRGSPSHRGAMKHTERTITERSPRTEKS